LNDVRTKHIPLEEVDEVARPAYLTRHDFPNEYADLSVGNLGSPDGFTTTIIRTDKGGNLFRNALQRGYIEEMKYRNSNKQTIEDTARLAKIVLFSARKKLRAKYRLKKLSS
jgi:coenzyme F420 hydrogenase subunit beta